MYTSVYNHEHICLQPCIHFVFATMYTCAAQLFATRPPHMLHSPRIWHPSHKGGGRYACSVNEAAIVQPFPIIDSWITKKKLTDFGIFYWSHPSQLLHP